MTNALKHAVGRDSALISWFDLNLVCRSLNAVISDDDVGLEGKWPNPASSGL
jgi:hypothetical protein